MKIRRSRLKLLGFILSADEVRPDPEGVSAIRQMPEPRNRAELQKCIGVCNYCRIFSWKYAAYIDPFRELLSEKSKFTWLPWHIEAFEKLKNQFSEHILLNYYLTDRPFFLQSNASKQGISAVLYQYDDNDN